MKNAWNALGVTCTIDGGHGALLGEGLLGLEERLRDGARHARAPDRRAAPLLPLGTPRRTIPLRRLDRLLIAHHFHCSPRVQNRECEECGVGCAGVPVGMESLLKVFLRGGAAKAVTDRQPHSRSVTSDCSGANTIALIGPGRTRSLSCKASAAPPHTPHTHAPHTPQV
jgi:hypothetical protein